MKKIKSYFLFFKNGKHYQFVKHIIETEEISVLQIIKYLLSFRKFIFYTILIFFSTGVIQTLTSSADSYTSKSVIIPDGGAPPSSLMSESISDLIPIQPSNGELGIESFPGIIENRTFLLKLLKEEILSEKYSGFLSLKEYIIKDQKTSNILRRGFGYISNLPNRFFSLFESDNKGLNESFDLSKDFPVDTLNVVTEEQLSLIANLSSLINVEGKNPITIETTMGQPKVSTRLNKIVIEKLVEEVTRIKTAKQQRDVELIKVQLDAAKVNFLKSQNVLAIFRDANKGNNSAYVLSTLARLSSDYSLYFGIYSSLATEHELAKIEVIKKTPFYEVIEPAYVPLKSNSEFNISSIINYSIMGIVFSIFIIFLLNIIVIIDILKSKLDKLL
jgi:hypothetical protein